MTDWYHCNRMSTTVQISATQPLSFGNLAVWHGLAKTQMSLSDLRRWDGVGHDTADNAPISLGAFRGRLANALHVFPSLQICGLYNTSQIQAAGIAETTVNYNTWAPSNQEFDGMPLDQRLGLRPVSGSAGSTGRNVFFSHRADYSRGRYRVYANTIWPTGTTFNASTAQNPIGAWTDMSHAVFRSGTAGVNAYNSFQTNNQHTVFANIIGDNDGWSGNVEITTGGVEDGVSPKWGSPALFLDCPMPISVTAYEIRVAGWSGANLTSWIRNPTRWILAGSNDKSVWTTVHNYSPSSANFPFSINPLNAGLTPATYPSNFKHHFDKPHRYQYWRITFLLTRSSFRSSININCIYLWSPYNLSYTPPYTQVIRGHANLVCHLEAESLRGVQLSTSTTTWHDLSDTDCVYIFGNGNEQVKLNDAIYGAGVGYVFSISGTNRRISNVVFPSLSGITMHKTLPNVSLEGLTTVIFFAAPTLGTTARLVESSGHVDNWLVRVETDGNLSSNATSTGFLKTSVPGGILKPDWQTRLNMYAFRFSTVSEPGWEYVDIDTTNGQAVSRATLAPQLSFNPTAAYGTAFVGVNYVLDIGIAGSLSGVTGSCANIGSYMVFNTHLSLADIYKIYQEQKPRFLLA